MLYLRRSRFIRFVILPLTLIAILPACYKWHVVGTNAASPTEVSSLTRVTLTNGEEVMLRDVIVTADSVFGRDKDSRPLFAGEERAVRINSDDVRFIERRSTNWLATGALIWLGVGVVVSLACAASDCFELFDSSN